MLSDHSPTPKFIAIALPQILLFKPINSQPIHLKYTSHVRYKRITLPLNASIHSFCLVLPKRLPFGPSSHPSHADP